MNEGLNYEDIIHLPAPVSRRHLRMSRSARAAQFAPFSALCGYAEAIQEAGRVTEERVSLCASEKSRIDRVLQKIRAELPGAIEVNLTRFLPDLRKEGGRYEKIHARVTRIDPVSRELVLDCGEIVPFQNILSISRVKTGLSVD